MLKWCFDIDTMEPKIYFALQIYGFNHCLKLFSHIKICRYMLYQSSSKLTWLTRHYLYKKIYALPLKMYISITHFNISNILLKVIMLTVCSNKASNHLLKVTKKQSRWKWSVCSLIYLIFNLRGVFKKISNNRDFCENSEWILVVIFTNISIKDVW